MMFQDQYQSFSNQKLNKNDETEDIIKQKEKRRKDKTKNSVEDLKFISLIEKGSNKIYDDSPELKKLKSSEFIAFCIDQSKEM